MNKDKVWFVLEERKNRLIRMAKKLGERIREIRKEKEKEKKLNKKRCRKTQRLNKL